MLNNANSKLDHIEWIDGIALEGSQTCVLCIHGFKATPHAYAELALHIHQQTGFSVLAPKLPGHGTQHEDLNHHNATTWKKFVSDQIQEVCRDYSTVHLVGYSWGATLIWLCLDTIGNAVASLSMIAPGLKLSNPWADLGLRLIKYAPTSYLKENVRIRPSKAKDYVNYDRYSYYAALQVDQTFRSAKHSKIVSNIPTWIAVPYEDAVIDPVSAKTLAKRCIHPKSTLIQYPNAHHVMLNSDAKDQIMHDLTSFLTGCKPKTIT